MKRHTVRIVLTVPVHPPSYSLYAAHTYGTTFWNSSRVSCVNTSVTCYLDCSAPCFVLFCFVYFQRYWRSFSISSILGFFVVAVIVVLLKNKTTVSHSLVCMLSVFHTLSLLVNMWKCLSPNLLLLQTMQQWLMLYICSQAIFSFVNKYTNINHLNNRRYDGSLLL